MSAAGRPYQRLPGKASGLFGAATLWLAADHVLQVRLRGYTEVYRRFYFRDLQALALRHTREIWSWAAALGLPALLAGAAALADVAPAWELWAVIAALFAVPLAIHLARGATCRCYATTPLGTTELVALRRVRAARRSLARIRAQAEEAQGPLTMASLPDTAMPATVEPRQPAFPPLPAAGPPPLPPRHATRWHRTLVALLAADAVLTTAQALTESRALDILGILFAVAEISVALGAIVVQGRAGLARPALRRFPWATLGYLGCLTLVSWVTSMVSAFGQISSGIAPTVSPARATQLIAAPIESLQIASIFGYLALALWGLLATRGGASAETVQ